MPVHRPGPMYAIRTRVGVWGTTYRVSLTRASRTVARLFRERDYGGAPAALAAAQAWRNAMAAKLKPRTKLSHSQRLQPNNTSGCSGVYLKHQRIRRGDKAYEYSFWQAHTPQGVKPARTRTFSVDRYGYDGAYALAVEARVGFLNDLRGYVGVTPIPLQYRPSEE